MVPIRMISLNPLPPGNPCHLHCTKSEQGLPRGKAATPSAGAKFKIGSDYRQTIDSDLEACLFCHISSGVGTLFH